MHTIRFFLSLMLLLSAFIVGSAAGQTDETLPLTEGWRFVVGDNPVYADPQLDHSQWKQIRTDKIWEEQGYQTLDRFAWYRIRVVIPYTMRVSSYLKDSLRIFLGKINNFDQTFLNGRIIGINGQTASPTTPEDTSFIKADQGLWNADRRYVLAFDDPRIRWDKENVIAVRVFDAGGQGGMWSGGQAISMAQLQDYVNIDYREKQFRFAGNMLTKDFVIRNTSTTHDVAGTLVVTGVNKITGAEVMKGETPVLLPPKGMKDVSVKIPVAEQSTIVTYALDLTAARQRISYSEETPYILTPKAQDPPRINCASIVGARPSRPFLFTIATTGKRPMLFEAAGLPSGLTLNSNTGIVSGTTPSRGEYTVELIARNAFGQVKRNLRLMVGDEIALTPPMGWNSWNCWGLAVDDGKILSSANAFVEKGLIDHGWTYINIDDGWEIKGDSPEPKREPDGTIRTNEKFKDMRRLGDQIHALGLKYGIYSSPGPLTCGGYTGTYGFELKDAQTFGTWGVDYLKYDWCSYEKIARDTSRVELRKPYSAMRDALDRVNRDIVYSLCQYGMGNVWEWGRAVRGNLWRTTGDITDTWESMSMIGFTQVQNAPYAGPGHWNDPDMLVVGWVGWGPNLHPTKLTPDEQYTHMSLWCLLSAPLLLGCDLSRLDEFTLNLLTNDEVIAIDQDPLGKQAVPVAKTGTTQIWVKDLDDGSKAIGLFNLGQGTEEITLKFFTAGMSGKARLRDLWRQRDLGSFSNTYSAKVPSHGVLLLRATPE